MSKTSSKSSRQFKLSRHLAAAASRQTEKSAANLQTSDLYDNEEDDYEFQPGTFDHFYEDDFLPSSTTITSQPKPTRKVPQVWAVLSPKTRFTTSSAERMLDGSMVSVGRGRGRPNVYDYFNLDNRLVEGKKIT